MLKSQNFEIVYKIEVKDWTFFTLILSFRNNSNTIQAVTAPYKFGELTTLEK